ncbi:ATP-binding protein [Enterococcus sp. LJL98]
MSKLKILPKTFIYTITIMGGIVLFVHALIYFGLPRFYYQQKNQDAKVEMRNLVEQIQKTPADQVLEKLANYAVKENVNLHLRLNGQTNYDFQGFTPLKIEYNGASLNALPIYVHDGTGKVSPIIVIQEQFKAHGQTYELQLMLNTQPIEETKQMTLRLLPYTLLLSFLLASLFAYLFSRLLTKPIKEVLIGTKKMEQLQPGAFIQVYSADEMGDLAAQINDLYEKLWKTIDSLEDKVRILGEVEEEKIQFLRGASHELKTPLTSLSILLENMQLNIGPYKNREVYLDKSLEMVRQLSEMLQTMLESSQLTTLPLTESPLTNIATILQTTIGDYEILAKSKQIDLQVTIETRTLMYPIPAKELSKVFSNLLSNSIHYTKAGETVNIQLTERTFSIENTGVTFSEETLQRLFQPYYRPDFSREKHAGGTGLGLYIVKTILEHYRCPFSFSPTDNSVIFQITFNHFI